MLSSWSKKSIYRPGGYYVKKKQRFNLRVKLVLFTTVLALITYTMSAIFIYVIQDYLQSMINMSEQTYVILILILGVDRKSTRLNSSHVAISYAVFCLKKKNR